jgi:glutathionyl-hydroquinone reductase
MTVVHHTFSDLDWYFPDDDEECPGASRDPIYGTKYLRDIYFRANKEYNRRFSVPILWDKKTEIIVNNESRYVIPKSNCLIVVRSFE